MTLDAPGSWIAVRHKHQVQMDELRGELYLEREARRAERRATTQAHKHFFDFLEAIGETDAFVSYLKRAQNVRRAA